MAWKIEDMFRGVSRSDGFLDVFFSIEVQPVGAAIQYTRTQHEPAIPPSKPNRTNRPNVKCEIPSK